MDAVTEGPAANGTGALIRRVNGPLVEVTGLAGVAMSDVVELGEGRLPGEAVAIRGDVTTIQAYEYTGGLAPGHPAWSRGEPLSALLGPHLLGGVFDGLLRPLAGAPVWLEPGKVPQATASREFGFTPEVADGASWPAGPGWVRWPCRARSATACWFRQAWPGRWPGCTRPGRFRTTR